MVPHTMLGIHTAVEAETEKIFQNRSYVFQEPKLLAQNMQVFKTTTKTIQRYYHVVQLANWRNQHLFCTHAPNFYTQNFKMSFLRAADYKIQGIFKYLKKFICVLAFSILLKM